MQSYLKLSLNWEESKPVNFSWSHENEHNSNSVSSKSILADMS